jgi:hypothetical protein
MTDRFDGPASGTSPQKPSFSFHFHRGEATMKYLAMTAAALFLLGAPATGFAQSDTSGGTGAGASQNGNGGNDDQTGSTNAVGGDSQCNDETSTSSYNSFSEKCRHQIDAWAMSQAGASTKFEGDVAVGSTVPESVAIIDVPVYHNYGYVMLNDHRVLVDRSTRKVIRVY